MQASMTTPTTFSTFKSILLPTFDLIGPNPLPPLTVCVRSRKRRKRKLFCCQCACCVLVGVVVVPSSLVQSFTFFVVKSHRSRSTSGPEMVPRIRAVALC